MKEIINHTDINTVDIIKDPYYNNAPGQFRFITKCRAGYLTCNDARDFDAERLYMNPSLVLDQYKKGALHTVQYKPSGSDTFFTVFARKGNKVVIMDESIMRGLEVGTVNQLWYKTNLYNQTQYAAVKAKTWADKVFVSNEAELVGMSN